MSHYPWVSTIEEDAKAGPCSVFVHVKCGEGHGDWLNQIYFMSRVPCVGELIELGGDAPSFRVEMVQHTPFSDQMQAEVYCIETDFSGQLHDLMSKLWPDGR